MLINDSNNSNRIIDYDIIFDDESKKTVLEILDDCFSKRTISAPTEETFLLHGGLKLSDLKWRLEDESRALEGGIKNLLMHYYRYGEPKMKRSTLGNIDLGKEILVSRTTIACSLSSTISFILHHLSKKEHELFISKLNSTEKAYIKALLDYAGYERLTTLLGSLEDIEALLKKCQNFDELMMLENTRLLEKIRYFKMVYNLATLRASKEYDRAYLNSVSYMSDEMEREAIQNIQNASTENTAMIKMLKFEPKRII